MAVAVVVVVVVVIIIVGLHVCTVNGESNVSCRGAGVVHRSTLVVARVARRHALYTQPTSGQHRPVSANQHAVLVPRDHGRRQPGRQLARHLDRTVDDRRVLVDVASQRRRYCSTENNSNNDNTNNNNMSLTGRQPLALFRTICRQNNPSGIFPAFWQT